MWIQLRTVGLPLGNRVLQKTQVFFSSFSHACIVSTVSATVNNNEGLLRLLFFLSLLAQLAWLLQRSRGRKIVCVWNKPLLHFPVLGPIATGDSGPDADAICAYRHEGFLLTIW